MIQRGRRARFVQEPVDHPPVARQLLRKELHRHVPAQREVLGAIDDAHAAAAHLIADAVVREGLPDHASNRDAGAGPIGVRR
jgi:hypothetical protein